jgi:hypothetical protein
MQAVVRTTSSKEQDPRYQLESRVEALDKRVAGVLLRMRHQRHGMKCCQRFSSCTWLAVQLNELQHSELLWCRPRHAVSC